MNQFFLALPELERLAADERGRQRLKTAACLHSNKEAVRQLTMIQEQ
jgi:hypothetical protein